MRKDATKPRLAIVGKERRKLPRKRVLLGGVLVDPNGESATDCTIQDINVHGAKIESPRTLQLADKVYLLNTRNETAHLATVARIEGGKTGLSFIRSYSLEARLPAQLEFLVKLLLEAKLRAVNALIERGVPLADATSVVGLTEDYLDRFVVRGPLDKKVERLLHEAKRLLRDG